METIVEKMQDEQTGVPVRTVKSFMSKVPSVFTGVDLVAWMMKNVDVEDQVEALHLASLMAAHGYFFPIDDHVLTVKNDNTYYRFQTPCFWPSRCGEPENTDYAVYLCKRTMQNKQRLELADYEAENLARLQKMFSRKWEFIFMQAEAQAKVDKKRDKLERKVLDSQERAFWDVHRPVPVARNTQVVERLSWSIEIICKKKNQQKTIKSSLSIIIKDLEAGQFIQVLLSTLDNLELAILRRFGNQSTRQQPKTTRCVGSARMALFGKKANSAEQNQTSTYESLAEFQNDCLGNPRDIPQRRVKRWAFSIEELLCDPAGKEQFSKFLDKEFSGENLKFWLACQDLKCLPIREVNFKVTEIFSEFLAPGAHNPVNVEGRISELVRGRIENHVDRYCFEEAQDHIFKLMKSDSYSRYLRSDMYKEFLSGTRKKSKKRLEIRKVVV
ncbi:regulator of G-protein signaling [Mytilus galloprovincialis]|uniref:Regulator of G-protein signaling n=1 Tax=Mytilus galloprovincialis TaxID=29158 RepID=A0A8B6DI28_MYTGA|nr:regulator of G-protein signaling [Mytilus galloprovincialis]